MYAKRFLVLLVLLLLAVPAVADQKIAFDPDVDFSKYKTYSWGKGTPAARAQIQRWIDLAIDRELQAEGLRKAPQAGADLVVVTVAYAQMEMAVRGNYIHLDRWDVGLISSDVINKQTGNLMVDLIDAETQEPVWRSVIQKAMSDRNLSKAQKKIDKLIKKMFEEFPPSPD